MSRHTAAAAVITIPFLLFATLVAVVLMLSAGVPGSEVQRYRIRR